MNYNLTDKQKAFAKWLVGKIRAGKISESFKASIEERGKLWIEGFGMVQGWEGEMAFDQVDVGTFDALDADRMVVSRTFVIPAIEEMRRFGSREIRETTYTVTARCFKAVESDFADVANAAPISTLAQPHPPEIAMSIDRLRERYPDPKKLGFLIMRFATAKPFGRIVEVIQKTAEEHGLKVLRADAHEFHAGVLENVRTYLHGCGFGIAVYERIETEEPNANVGLEVGYLMAMNKPVLLLKDKTVPTLQADLAGKLYKPFDPHDPENTIPAQLTKWLEDYGIIVPNRNASSDNSPAL